MQDLGAELWPHRVETLWGSDQAGMRRWLEQNVDCTTWFFAAANVVYFSHKEDAMRFSLIWT